MNELTQYQGGVPDTPQDLAKFILFGQQKLVSVRAEIKAIKDLKLAQEVEAQKMEEARMLSEALLDAQVLIGEMTRCIPHAPADRGNQYTGGKTTPLSVSQKPKKEVIAELGFTPKQVERFEILANNKDLVEQVKQEARENDDIPTRSHVISLAQHRKKQQEAQYRQIDEDAEKHKAFVDMIYTVLDYIGSETEFEDVTDAIVRSANGNVGTDIKNLEDALTILSAIKSKLITKGAAYGKK